MSELTLGFISDEIAFILVFCGGLYAVYRGIKSAVKKLFKEEFEGFNKRIEGLETKISDLETQVQESDAELGEKIDKLNMHNCKNFLVRFLSDVERGAVISEVERERFAEEWDFYTKHGGNSYLKNWYDKLQKKGWL